MIVTHEREKLVQAISFFAHHTRKLGKTKLYKLLYFLDFEHFKQTGRSVTGLFYSAWKMGPVPVALHNEIEDPGADLSQAIEFQEVPLKSGAMLAVKAKTTFSPEHFSGRELGLMRSLASEYRDADAESMVEATHLENSPWHKVWNEQGLHQAGIPYELAVRPDEGGMVMNVAKARKELLDSLK